MKQRPLHSANGNIHWVIIVGLFIIAVILGVSMMWQKQELAAIRLAVGGQRPVSPSAAVNSQQEYDFFCTSGASAPADIKKAVDPILDRQNWSMTASDGVRVCYPIGGGGIQRALVISETCTEQQANCYVGLLEFDLAAKSFKVLAKEETSELFGTTLIWNIVQWTPSSVTYRFNEEAGEGYQCTEQTIASAFKVQEKTVTNGTSSSIRRSCNYTSCRDFKEGLLTCGQ